MRKGKMENRMEEKQWIKLKNWKLLGIWRIVRDTWIGSNQLTKKEEIWQEKIYQIKKPPSKCSINSTVTS